MYIQISIYFEKSNIYNMPQLIPFYFLNQAVFVFFLLSILIFVFSKYILPRILELYISRNEINKI
jgi:F-type H+-transporting ATPase subunit 8